MHKFLVCAYKSQEFAQSQNFFARLHDRETVTFRNSGIKSHPCVYARVGSARCSLADVSDKFVDCVVLC